MDGGDNLNRRQGSDRREHGGVESRRGATRSTSPIVWLLRAVGAIAVLVLVIVYAVSNTRPIYATRGSLGEELRKHAPEVAKAIGVDTTDIEQIMATPKFREEKRNFFADVMKLKQVDSARADSIAQYAVREAYLRGISPAIIFGVMLTENARFISKATSNVGAVGLMQVYPKVWATKEMTAKLGKDIATDSTNVKYGVFILSHYFHPRTSSGAVQERDWATALLRYNGCVKGTNTPRCHTYPNKVQQFIEGSAKSICDGRDFYDCIAKPFLSGLFTAPKTGVDTSARTAQAGVMISPPPEVGTSVAVAPIRMPPTLVVTPPMPVVAPPTTAAAPAVPPTHAPVLRSRSSVPRAVSPSNSSSRRRTSASSKAPNRSAPARSARKSPAKKMPAARHTTRKKSPPVKRAPARKRETELKAPKPITVKIP